MTWQHITLKIADYSLVFADYSLILKIYFADYSLVYLVLNLFIIVLCGFVYFCNVWGCVFVGFVL